MYGSRALARATKSSKSYASKNPIGPISLSHWRDLPILSRYTGHIILGLLFVALLYGVSPLQLDLPALNILGRESHSVYPSEYYPTYSYAYSRPMPNAQYLEPGVIPFTIRSWGDTLPIIPETRRMQRTSVTVYTVQPGDTTLGIAQRFGLRGTSVLYSNDQLAEQPDLLKIGQELLIPPVDGALHTVARGDTLSSIAEKYKVDADIIINYPGNDLVESQELVADQQLIIPGGVKTFVPRQVVTYQAPAAPAAPVTAGSSTGSVTGSGQLSWPMSGKISQRYWEGHRAIDIAAPRGTSILAADGGTVASAQWANGYGRMVVIDHGNGYQTLYAHMDAYYVEIGHRIDKGQVIGKCGSTGNSTGPHLHFEVRKGGVLLNPFNFLP